MEAALRAAGGNVSGLMAVADITRSCSGEWNTEGPPVRLEADTGCAGSGDCDGPGSLRRPRDASARRRSRELPLPLKPGGGGNGRVAATGGSGEGRWPSRVENLEGGALAICAGE